MVFTTCYLWLLTKIPLARHVRTAFSHGARVDYAEVLTSRYRIVVRLYGTCVHGAMVFGTLTNGAMVVFDVFNTF